MNTNTIIAKIFGGILAIVHGIVLIGLFVITIFAFDDDSGFSGEIGSAPILLLVLCAFVLYVLVAGGLSTFVSMHQEIRLIRQEIKEELRLIGQEIKEVQIINRSEDTTIPPVPPREPPRAGRKGRFCQACDAQMSDGGVFCPDCGMKAEH